MAKTKHRQIISHSPEETMNLAAEIASKLKGGEVLALTGELGGGKTTFTKGLAEALKVEESITSPTFVMLKSYPGKIGDKNIQLVHIDAYRAESIEDIKSVGIEDYLNRNDVVMAIEWAEKIRNLPAGRQVLPENTININFEFVGENTENTRKILVK